MVQAPETKCSQTDSIYFIPITVDILNEFIHPDSDFRVVRGAILSDSHIMWPALPGRVMKARYGMIVQCLQDRQGDTVVHSDRRRN